MRSAATRSRRCTANDSVSRCSELQRSFERLRDRRRATRNLEHASIVEPDGGETPPPKAARGQHHHVLGKHEGQRRTLPAQNPYPRPIARGGRAPKGEDPP